MAENQPVQSTVTNSQAEALPNSPEKREKPWVTIGLSILVLFLLGITGFLAYQNHRLKQQISQTLPTSLPKATKTLEIPSPTPTVDTTTDWETYTNTLAGFSIKHPSGWRKVETENSVGFGPQEIGEDVLWGIYFYNKSAKTISQIKDEVGKQFSDRKQSEETVTFGGLTAIKVVTTTNQYADWYSVTIIIDSEGVLYAIGNGAQTDVALNEMLKKTTGEEYNLTFEDFYTSFKPIK